MELISFRSFGILYSAPLTLTVDNTLLYSIFILNYRNEHKNVTVD